MARRSYTKKQISGGRTPRHYSRLLEGTPAVKIGLAIMAAILAFLAIAVLSVFV